MTFRSAAIVIGVMAIARLIVASYVPLSEDESYYWSWSRHLAWGYTDHPPAVAWLIALGSPLGSSAGAIRLPFVLCYTLAALALGRAALALSGSSRAGGIAALAFALLPTTKIMLGQALPDGPYILCWAVALWSTAEIRRKASLAWVVVLGLALGGALLSRLFGWALLGGVLAYFLFSDRHENRYRGVWLAFVVAAVTYSPFLIWNATHNWQNFSFNINRQSFHPLVIDYNSIWSTLRATAYGLGICILGYFVALRERNALVALTALPLVVLFILLGAFTTVESYWLLGPFASLCVGIGIVLAPLSVWKRRLLGGVVGASAAYTFATLLFLALPERSQAALLAHWSGARDLLYAGGFMYAPLAQSVAELTASQNGFVAMTDRPEIASELYYHGLRPMMVGRAPQTAQWNGWPDLQRSRNIPARGLLVTYSPLAEDLWLAPYMAGLYERLEPGPILHIRHAGADWGTFHTTWCTRPRVK